MEVESINKDFKDNSDLAVFMQGMVMVTSVFLSGFLIIQKLRGRGSPEVIYVSMVTVIVYGSNILSGKSLTWVTITGGLEVPLGRYFSWLMTCPVILMQFVRLYELVGGDLAKQAQSGIIILDQVMIVTGAFGAVSIGAQKWIFFLLSISAGTGLYTQVFYLARENYRKFPSESRSNLLVVNALFFCSWLIFPILWIVGSPGFNMIDQDSDVIAHCIGDFVAKNCFGLAGWYLRWSFDYSNVNGSRSQSKQVSPGAVGLSKSGIGLTDQDMDDARGKRFCVLLLEGDVLIIKCITLMLEKADVELKVANTVALAKAMMAVNKCDKFDAVILFPKTCKQLVNVDELTSFSEYICQPPFKIPLLGGYFDVDRTDKEPGDFVHGLIPRPLDEDAFKATLLQWRLTAKLWRKVADSVQAIEGHGMQTMNRASAQRYAEQGRNSPTYERDTGFLFGGNLVPQLKHDRPKTTPIHREKPPPRAASPVSTIEPTRQRKGHKIESSRDEWRSLETSKSRRKTPPHNEYLE